MVQAGLGILTLNLFFTLRTPATFSVISTAAIETESEGTASLRKYIEISTCIRAILHCNIVQCMYI
jgi:hypothetical protein